MKKKYSNYKLYNKLYNVTCEFIQMAIDREKFNEEFKEEEK